MKPPESVLPVKVDPRGAPGADRGDPPRPAPEHRSERAAAWTSHDKVLAGLLASLIVAAWGSLFVWERSPYGRFLSHENLDEAAFGSPWFALALVGGWVVMTIAMMLPTSWPLLMLFNTITARRDDHRRLVGLVVAGYLGVWLAFGIAVHVADLGVHRIVDAIAGAGSDPWFVGAGVLVVAGAYQFSSLKYRCLAQCRSPFAFIASHWHGRSPAREALRLGVSHGAYCLGCCWSLMLIMFAVGLGSIGWMLTLGVVMAIEKNIPFGRSIGAPIGWSLLAMGALSVVLRVPVL